MKRKREPGFYVSVRLGRADAFGLPGELLDGPWPTREAAHKRVQEMMAQREGEAARHSVVQVAEDGVTVLRDTGGR